MVGVFWNKSNDQDQTAMRTGATCLSNAQLFAAVLVFGLAVPAIAQEAEPEVIEIEEVEEIDIEALTSDIAQACFNTREIRSFDAFTNDQVYVRGRRDQHYLLTMWGPCFGLRNSFEIGIANGFNRVCSNDSARIVYRDAGRMETCRIRTVEAVANKEAAEEIAELRRRAE